MIIADLQQMAGRSYPARRKTQNLAGGLSPIQTTHFSMGYVTLEPKGGQVPWHNQEQEEVYYCISGKGTVWYGTDKKETPIEPGVGLWIPRGVEHAVTNTGNEQLQIAFFLAPGRK